MRVRVSPETLFAAQVEIALRSLGKREMSGASPESGSIQGDAGRPERDLASHAAWERYPPSPLPFEARIENSRWKIGLHHRLGLFQRGYPTTLERPIASDRKLKWNADPI